MAKDAVVQKINLIGAGSVLDIDECADPISQGQLLIMLEDFYADLIENADSLIGAFGLKQEILTVKMLEKTGAFIENTPARSPLAIFSKDRLNTKHQVSSALRGWRYRTQLITLLDFITKKLPAQEIEVIKLGASPDGVTMRIMNVKVSEIDSLIKFKRILNFIDNIADELRSEDYFMKAFETTKPQQFHLLRFGKKATSEFVSEKTLERLWDCNKKRPIPIVRGRGGTKPSVRYLAAQKQLDVILNGVEKHPSILQLLTEAGLKRRAPKGTYYPEYSGNVSRDFWRRLTGETLHRDQKIPETREVKVYAFASDDIHSFLNWGDNSWLIDWDADTSGLIKELDRILKRVRDEGVKLSFDPHDDLLLGMVLAELAHEKGIAWHTEHLLAYLLEYVTEYKMKAIVEWTATLGRASGSPIPFELSYEVARIVGDEGTNYRLVGTIGTPEGRWLADHLKIYEIITPGYPAQGKWITVWIQNKPAMAKSGELTILQARFFARRHEIVNDLRKVFNRMRNERDYVVSDTNVRLREFRRKWKDAKWVNLSEDEWGLLKRLGQVYHTNNVVGEYGLMRWIGFEWTPRNYHSTGSDQWFEPHSYFIALESFQPNGHMLRDYLYRLRFLEDGRFRHFVDDLEIDIKTFDLDLTKFRGISISTRFLWPDSEYYGIMGEGEALLSQIREIAKDEYRKLEAIS